MVQKNKTIKINDKHEKLLLKKARKISVVEGSAYSVMDGFGLKYITPYALALGANNTYIGFLSSIPSLLGNFSQLLSSKLIEKFPRKKLVFISVFLQAIMWLFLILVGSLFFIFNFNSDITSFLLIIVYTILAIFGAFPVPAWNSWMKDIVTEKTGKYFGKRARICGSIALASMLLAGFILDYFKQTRLFVGFIVLFFIAFVFRSISALLFLRQYEPKLQLEKDYYFSFKQFVKKMPHNNFGKFVIFISLMQFAVAIASPFFAVYMLKHLSLSYKQFTFVVIGSSIASLLFVTFWGKFADKHGNLKVLKINGLFIPLIPFLWLLSPLLLKYSLIILLLYLIVIELFSGFAWAGFNLSASNFVYDTVTKQRMALCVAYSNILYSIGVFVGAILGGLISSTNFIFFSLNSMLFIFLLSAVVRFAIYLIMIGKIKEVRKVEKFDGANIEKRFINHLSLNIQKHINLLDKILKPRQT